MDLTLSHNEVGKKVQRQDIVDFENLLRSHPDAVFGDNEGMPLVHTFADNIYVRQITIPTGTVLVGKIHRHCHPNFLLKGIVEVATEFGGVERLEAPQSIISKAGTKRTVHVIQEAVWVTVHENPTNTRDLVELEKFIIAESYDEYEKFEAKKLKGKISFTTKCINFVKSLVR